MSVFVACLAPSSGQCQFSMTLVPQVAEVKIRRGQRGVIPFTLTNTDKNKALRIRVHAKDILQGSRGEYTISDSTMPYSCIPWLMLPDSIIEVPPGRSHEVAVLVHAPVSASGGAYGAVVFEMLPDKPTDRQPKPGSARLDYSFQLPGWIEITVESHRPLRGRLSPQSVTVEPTAQNPQLQKKYGDYGMLVTAQVENTGNIHVFTEGRLIIRDENHRLVKDTQLGSGRGAILPGAVTTLRTITKLPPPGKYDVKAIVEYGGRSPAIAQTTFEISRDFAARAGQSAVARPLYIDVRPEELKPSVPTSGFRVLALSLLNREQEPVEVNIELRQFSHDENGNIWVSEETADTGRTCAPWMTVEPDHFVMDPDKRKNVRITLGVPDDVAGGYYSCLVVNTRLASDTSATSLPSPIYCPISLSVPPSFDYLGEIIGVKVEHPIESAVLFKTKFRNTGNIHTIISGAVNIEYWKEPEQIPGLVLTDTAQYEKVGIFKLETDSTAILPGETRVVSSPSVSGLPGGRYRARFAIRYGADTPATIEKEFTIESSKSSN